MIDEELKRLFEWLRQDNAAAHEETRRVLREESVSAHEETRRLLRQEIAAAHEDALHRFDIMTSDLRDQIKLVAEGVTDTRELHARVTHSSRLTAKTRLSDVLQAGDQWRDADDHRWLV